MYDIGIGTGPFLQGLYIPHFGYRGLYFTMGAIAIVGIVMYYFAHGRTTEIKTTKPVWKDQVQ